MRAKRARELRRAATAHVIPVKTPRIYDLFRREPVTIDLQLARQLYRRLKRAYTRRNAT